MPHPVPLHKPLAGPTKRSNSGSGDAAGEDMTFKKVECTFAAGLSPEQVPWLTILRRPPQAVLVVPTADVQKAQSLPRETMDKL
ncbi:hypothetical protein BV25DRAFT_1913647 [Artomyces pyxidatus]|uniref:Uncharacterized protein n=1 Tax=Artomyces pyxidatus TaxID=48021 RepID=A0ACB8TBW5_9AGAM|nr:hypothetical protein BV25DRAFT_1913647 [Artomyces pyxidatus]